MRSGTKALAIGAGVALVLAGCSSDDEPDEGAQSTGTSVVESGMEDPEAAARTAAVAYFEAFAVLDYETARDASGEAAELVIDWAEAVDGIGEVEGTPYEFVAAPSVEVTVSIEDVAEAGDGVWDATGYLRLENHPPGLVPGEVPPDLQTDPPSWFVTDLAFVEDDDGGFSVVDYRMDDAEYPVSALFTTYDDAQVVVVEGPDGDAAAGTTTTASDGGEGNEVVDLEMGRRALDGSVQYVLAADAPDDPEATLTAATFFEGAEPGDEPVAAEGGPVDLFLDGPTDDEATTTTAEDDGAEDEADDADATEEDGHVLAVRPGAFPGEEPGVLRLTFADATGATVWVVDVAVPGFEPSDPQPTNTVREAQVETSTTTTSSSTTTTSEPPETVTSIVTVPSEDSSTTTSTTTPSSSSSSSSSSTTP